MKPVFPTLSLLFICALFLGLFGWNGPPRAQAQNSATSNSTQDKGNRRPVISTGTQLATSELLRIEQEAQQLNQRLAASAQDAETARQLADVRPQVTALMPGASTICASTDQAVKDGYYNRLRRIIDRAGEVIGDSRPGPWVSPPNSAQDLCATADFPAVVLREIDAQIAGAERAGQDRATIEGQLTALNERRDQVLREMTENLAGTSVAHNIPWLMLIIFGVGAVTLAGVKIFSDEVQRELIASGQIVQFVTILILLGVILALGLAQRLAAETLGTLLGGLAGYVLSQGVGRQAQQQVLNEIKSAAATAPPPPPPAPTQG